MTSVLIKIKYALYEGDVTIESEIKNSEQGVQKVFSAINGFVNPLKIQDKDHLYIISSGAPVPADIGKDVLRADALGREAKETFIKERIYKIAGVLCQEY